MIPQNYPIPLLAVLTWQDLDRVFMEKTMGKQMPRSHVLIFRNYGTGFETLEGCFMSVFEQVVMVFDTNNTLFLMKCSNEDMLEGMMLLPVGVSLLLKKYRKEDVLESMVLLLMGVSLLLLKCSKDGMLEGMLPLPLGMSMLVMNRSKDVMPDDKVMAPVSTPTTHRKA